MDKLNTSLSELQGQIMRLSLEQDHIKSIVKEEATSPSPSYWLPSDTNRLADAFKTPQSHYEPPKHHIPSQSVPTQSIAASENIFSSKDLTTSSQASVSSVAFPAPLPAARKNDSPAQTTLTPQNKLSTEHASNDRAPTPSGLRTSPTEAETPKPSNPLPTESDDAVPEAVPNGFFVDFDHGRPLRPKPKLGARPKPKPEPEPVAVNGYQAGEVFEVAIQPETTVLKCFVKLSNA